MAPVASVSRVSANEAAQPGRAASRAEQAERTQHGAAADRPARTRHAGILPCPAGAVGTAA